MGLASTVEGLLQRLNEPSAESDRLSQDAMVAVAANLKAIAAWTYLVGSNGTLRLAGSCGLDDDLVAAVSSLNRDASDGAARCAATQTAQTVILDATAAVARGDRAILERTRTKQLRAIPLLACGGLCGVLVFANRLEPPPPERIEAVATALALALGGLEARRMASSADELLVRTTRSTQQLADYLGRVPRALLQTLVALPERRPDHPEDAPGFDVHEFLTLVVERACQLVDAEMGAIGIGSSPEHPFHPWVFFGTPPDVETAVGRPPRPVGTLAAVAIRGETLRVRDVRKHPAFIGFPPHHPEIRSLLAVALRFRGESFGNLYLANKRSAAEFDAADQMTIEMLAAVAATGERLSKLLATVERDRTTLLDILEAEPDGVSFVEARTGYLLTNHAFDTMLGITVDREKGIGQKLGILCQPNGRPLTLDELPSTRALRGEVTPGAELLVARPDGRTIPVSERAAPVRAADGTVLGAVVTLRDISLSKELDRLREEFAAMVAHDLRNPVQLILLEVDMCRKALDEGKPIPGAHLDRLSRAGARLVQMVSDLLNSSRIELSRVRLERVPVQVVEAVHHAVQQIRPTLGGHQIVVEAEGEPPTATLDPIRFDQILTNLIENAARYSPEGSTIHVRIEPADAGVAVSVRDEGMGIAAAEIPKLFDRFYQAKRASERGATGLGLGLYITKGFVEAHGGTIDVESAIGQGSTFRVWFPSVAPPPAADRP